MKKTITAILMFDLALGLLFLCLLVSKNISTYIATEDSYLVDNLGENFFITGDSEGETSLESDATVAETLTERRIALTFDDGPHPRYTEQLLDGLKERDVVVTFFVTGEHAALHPDVIERMHKEGHMIGNHTYSHMQLNKKNLQAFKEELLRTSEVIEEIIGEEVLYVRPPYGSWNKSIEEDLNMFPVLWTVDPLDWCSSNVEAIVNRIVKNTREDDIILMHDYYATSVEAALQAVDRLLEQGYHFVTVEEIMFD